MSEFVDIHTHNTLATPPSVIAVEPGFEFDEGKLYSVGIHPWNSALATPDTLAQLQLDALRPNVVAIGETGLDKLRGADIPTQLELLELHARVSSQTDKPLILHIVKAWNEIIELKQRLKPQQDWIIHGFRGNQQLAEQLLKHGFHLSLGERFNPQAAAIIPADRLHFETDESAKPIAEIAQAILAARPLPRP